MSGLPRFDFYPADWLRDTALLSDRAKGCYIDLLAHMYAKGGPLPYDEDALARLARYKNVRSIRVVLMELIEQGMFSIVEGMLVNNRAVREIEAAKQRIANGKKGGRPRSEVKQTGNEAETTAIQNRFQPDFEDSFVEEQEVSGNPLPSPPPSPPEERKEREESLSRAVPPVSVVAGTSATVTANVGADVVSELEPGLPFGGEPESKPKLKASEKAAVSEVDEAFDRFWAAYPKRQGANPKQQAKMIFVRLVRGGTNADVIVHAAERYAKEMQSDGKLGTQWVAHATTWLNQKRWSDYTADNVHTGNFGEGQSAEPEWKTNRRAWQDVKKAPPWPDAPRGTRCGQWLKVSNGWVLDR